MSLRLKFLLPLLTLALIGVTTGIRLIRGGDAPLFIGELRPAPAIAVEALPEGPPLTWPTASRLRQQGRLVNFWASWCAPCALEHPLLMELAAKDIPIDGILYKDSAVRGRLVLDRHGNPYARSGQDPTGDAGLAFGIIGVPETFLINAEGQIIHVYRGPLDREDLSQIKTLLHKAQTRSEP